jgi:hypothetical protein
LEPPGRRGDCRAAAIAGPGLFSGKDGEIEVFRR